MITAILTTIGVFIGLAVVVIAAIYGIVKLVLNFIGFVGGNISNGYNKIRRK